jgi:hypothetical protein
MAQEIRQITTSYVHSTDPNLLNIHKAMVYRDDEPHLRVTLGSDNITITGDVNLVDNVRVNNSLTNPVPVFLVNNTVTILNTSFSITNFPTTSTVYQGTIPWVVTGTVAVNNLQTSITVTNFTSTVNITSMPAVSGTVAISSLPAVTGTVTVNGSVTVTNFTSTVYVGNIQTSVTVTNFTSTVHVDNFPTSVTVTNFTSTVFVSNTLTISNTSIAITNFPTTSTVYQGTNPWTVTGNVNATITGTSTTTLGTGSTDAFGRLRTSQPYTLFDSRARYYDHNDFSSSTSTGATVVYDANGSTYQLNVTAANGSSVIRETKRVFPYQPGKSLLVMTTFCMNTPKTNLRQRVGYFTTNNGIYFENDGTYNYLVIRSYSSGALVEDRVRQDAWDNPFAGLNVDRTQIFWTDIEWLGVGSVRCGFVVNGAYVLCHTLHHANVAGNTTTYMTTAVLPVRYEITNTAGTSGASMMRQICSTVISEGGYNAFTYSETAGRGTSVLRLSSAGTYYPVVSIRLDSTRLDAIVLPRQVDVLSPTVNYYRWKLVLNPTLTNADWAGHSASGTVEYDTAATAISGGTELQAGYVSSRELSELGADAFAFQLGRTLAGVSDIVTLAMAATSNNADVLAQIGWQEIT